MLHGVVIRTYSGFCYVEIDNEIWECRLRGKFRLTKQTVLAGDRVRIGQTGNKTGVIEEVFPRITQLDRPPVANVNQGVIVFACADPDPQRELLDRMLVQMEHSELFPIICFNKTDLVSEEAVENLLLDYTNAGYTVLCTSAVKEKGVNELKRNLKGHLTVFAGPSGSGKSSLLNAVHSGFSLKTGSVSEKIGRGRHTTRFAELLKVDENTWVVDTPGFSTLYMPEMQKEHLAEMFPEFLCYIDDCKFNGCLHRSEPGCAVKDALEEGKLSPSRYAHYLVFLDELISRERSY